MNFEITYFRVMKGRICLTPKGSQEVSTTAAFPALYPCSDAARNIRKGHGLNNRTHSSARGQEKSVIYVAGSYAYSTIL